MFNPAKIFVSFLALASVTDAKPSALRQSSSNEDEKKSHLIESFDLVALTLRSAPLIDETNVDPSFFPVGEGTCVDVNGNRYWKIITGWNTVEDAQQCGEACIARAETQGYPLVGIEMSHFYSSTYCYCHMEYGNLSYFPGSGVVAGAEFSWGRPTCYRYNLYVSPSCETNIEGVKARNAGLVEEMDVKKQEVEERIQEIQNQGTQEINNLVSQANTCLNSQ